MQQQDIIDECTKLAKHQTEADFYCQLSKVLDKLGFYQYNYFAVPCSTTTDIDINTHYISSFHKEYTPYYLQQQYGAIDPMMQAALNKCSYAIKWQLAGQKTTISNTANNTKLPYQAQELINRNTYLKKQIDLFNHSVELDIAQGIAIGLHNYLGIIGGIYITFKGTWLDFDKFYTPAKHQQVSLFMHAFHKQIQSKYSANFTQHLLPQLSPRELSILNYLCYGNTGEQIAYKLHITFGTVRTHINHILKKLRAENTTHACVIAIQLGLFE
jgi:DNA-binding CsgD family transcriptional regulator